MQWHAIGEIGVDAKGLVKQLDALQGANQFEQADIILISIGVNDVTSLTPTQSWQAALEKVIQHFSSRPSPPAIVFCGVPPMQHFPLLPEPLKTALGLRARRLDSLLVKLTQTKPRCTHLPITISPEAELFSADGYHPSDQGYRDFAERLSNHIFKSLPCLFSLFEESSPTSTREIA
ncbi:hypothetical protein GCM10025776_22060 [Corallincola platygyrae]